MFVRQSDIFEDDEVEIEILPPDAPAQRKTLRRSKSWQTLQATITVRSYIHDIASVCRAVFSDVWIVHCIVDCETFEDSTGEPPLNHPTLFNLSNKTRISARRASG